MRVDMGYLEYMRHKTGQNKAKKNAVNKNSWCLWLKV